MLEPPCRIGPMRSRRLALGPGFPPYLVLLRVGFTLPQPLLPARCALTAPFHPYRTGRPGRSPSGQLSMPKHGHPAVCFLWHWPSVSLYAHVPDVIRHTALRSSDFPLPAAPGLPPKASGSDRPVLLPASSLPRIRIRHLLNSTNEFSCIACRSVTILLTTTILFPVIAALPALAGKFRRSP